MSQLNWNELLQAAESSGGGSYEPLPDGTYDLKVVEATDTVTQTGKVMFKVKAEVQTGAYAKRLVWDNLVISTDNNTALSIFFSKMGALGLNRDFFGTSPAPAQIAGVLAGRMFRAQIGSRVWNGEKRNEIKRYMPMEGAVASAPAAAPVGIAPAPPAPAPAPGGIAPAPAYVAPAEAAPPAPPF